MVLAKLVIVAACVTAHAVSALPHAGQKPLVSETAISSAIQPPAAISNTNVTEELLLAEIIPTVTDFFIPLVDLSISWPSASADLGNTIKPALLEDEPQVHLSSVAPSPQSPRRKDVHPSTDVPLNPNGEQVVYEQFVVVLTDPDAKSRDNPKWAETCHWIAYWPVTSTTSADSLRAPKKEEIMEYKPPSAPPKTWKHRYVFLVLTPLNGTTDKLNLTVPSGRHRWGNERIRTGARQWAEQNGLGVIGANFIYSMHKKQ